MPDSPASVRAAAHDLPASLDETVTTVRKALADRDVGGCDVLLFCASGVGALRDELRHGNELALGDFPGVPRPWQGSVLYTGAHGASRVWLIEDLAGDPSLDAPPAWVAGFPVWLAAASGASVCVHTSAGVAVPGGEAPAEALAVLRDHLNLSGSTPLLGLGASRLGPMFPDLSRLHHVGLRGAARRAADELGIPLHEAVAAATAGPALSTGAERRLQRQWGADVAVPGLAPPLLAAGHAGLALLALVAVVEAEDEAVDVPRTIERAVPLQRALDRLLASLEGPLHDVVVAHRDDEQPDPA